MDRHHVRPPFTLWQRLGRLIHYRLVVPLLRSQHPPEFTARGVAIGVFWAFTPLFGLQMGLVGLTWLAARFKPPLTFNLIVALAWTWVTNVFTILPTYYVFYITGKLMLGKFDNISGYGAFTTAWEAALKSDGWIQPFLNYLEVVATEQGLPLAIGWIPFAIGLAWLSYRWSLSYMIRRRRQRAARIAKKRERRLAKLATRAVKWRGRGDEPAPDYDSSPS